MFTEVLLIELQINTFFFLFRSATTKKIQSMSIFHLLSKRLHFRKENTKSYKEKKIEENIESLTQTSLYYFNIARTSFLCLTWSTKLFIFLIIIFSSGKLCSWKIDISSARQFAQIHLWYEDANWETCRYTR